MPGRSESPRKSSRPTSSAVTPRCPWTGMPSSAPAACAGSSPPPPDVEALWPAERLREMLPLVDILILAVPLTQLTRGMIGPAELALMKPGSILINVARGPLVVEDALVAALESGHLYAAGVDVTALEPLPATSKLWDLPNVIITPHVGGQSKWRI